MNSITFPSITIPSVTLKQVGWRVVGETLLNLWGGGQGVMVMDPSSIPLGRLTKDNLHRCINDGGMGCESIESAILQVAEEYECGVYLDWREIKIKNPNPALVCRGV